MQRFRTWTAATLLVMLAASSLQAHFLFIRIGAHAEAGRHVSVFFSERAEAGDPIFVGKIAHTKLWMQTKPGKFSPLKVKQATDRLRSFLPSTGAIGVVGECRYGVLTRKVPFLLEYFPKAVAGTVNEVNALKTRSQAALEIVGRFTKKGVELSLLNKGKPVPNAKFITVDDDLANEEITADKSGKAIWNPEDSGYFCVYAKYVVNKSGEYKGKKYTEIRRFATLAFAWPLIRTDADAEAVKAFQSAVAARATWQKFPGFQADIEGMASGRFFEGTVKVKSDGSVTVKLDEANAKPWVQQQLESIVLHRRASSRRGKPVLRFAHKDEGHPLGRLMTFVGGSMASSYRVRERQIVVVNRNMGRRNMTITVLENKKNVEGKFLPAAYTVQFWHAKTGQLLQTDSVLNRWKRVGKWDLPTRNTVTSSTSAGFELKSFELSGLKLLKK